MACFSGPEILNDGLVFCYDQGNTDKSWRGAPAVNLAASNFFDGNENFTVDENVSHVMPDGSTGIARLLNAQFVSNLNRTVSIGSYALTAGQTYTLSFYVMNIDCTGFSGNLYSPTLLRVIGNITYPTVSTSSWTRVTTTFTVPNEGPNPVTLAPQAFRDGGNGRFKLCWLQLEQNTFATPYVNGTRSNTQALLDMTGQNTITANSLTYASNNTFSFDGGESNAIDCGGASAIKPTAGITVSTWIKFNSAAGNNRILSDWHQDSTVDRWIFYTPDSTSVVWYMTSNGQTEGGTTGYSFTAGQWVNLTGTYNQLQQILYVNGVQHSSVSRTGTLKSGNSSQTVRIGRQATTGLSHNGSISNVQIYNRALTAIEVKQNFEAARGRYGI
jgi:hypothetical protein